MYPLVYLHDALPIYLVGRPMGRLQVLDGLELHVVPDEFRGGGGVEQ